MLVERENTGGKRGVTLLKVLLFQLQPQGVLFMAEARQQDVSWGMQDSGDA